MTRYLLFFISFLTISCSQNQSVNSSEAGYYYYPEKNVYYSLTNQHYYYSLNGGNTWDSLLLESETDPGTLGDKVIVEATTDPVWRDNAKHLKAYKGSMLNVVSPDSNYLATATDVVTERKANRKWSGTKSSKKQEVQSKNGRTGVKDFFKNIFGKKKKQEI